MAATLRERWAGGGEPAAPWVGEVGVGGVGVGTRRGWEDRDVAEERETGRETGLVVNAQLVIPAAELSWRFSGSGGPGGQHANTANTKVDLRFDVDASEVLTSTQRQRLRARFGREVRVVESSRRSQARNREVALERLAEKVRTALAPRAVRRPTRPGRGAVERRLSAKRRQSERKSDRRRPRWD